MSVVSLDIVMTSFFFFSQRILEIFGDWLYEKREFSQAASGSRVFFLAHRCGVL